jgi:hypothetical protein
MVAGVLLVVTGVFHLLVAIAVLAGDDDVVHSPSYSFEMNRTSWGWTELVLAVLAIAVGAGVLAGRSWAYVSALVIAFLSAVTTFAFLPQSPLWSMLVLGFDALVMWALVTELKDSA